MCIVYEGQCLRLYGKNEREKFETDRANYSDAVKQVYDEAKTYHDGKWIMFELVDNTLFDDIKNMLVIKRKPNKK